MKISSRVLYGGLAALYLCVLAPSVHATQIQFTIDPSGTANGLVGVAPTAANRGIYAAGSYLNLSGNMNVPFSPVAASGNLKATSTSSGSFPTGDPGSLTGFFGGTLNVDLDNLANPSSIALTGGSNIAGINYNRAYAETPGNPVFSLAPAIGGGTLATPGKAPADFGIRLMLSSIATAPINGNAALRNVVGDIAQTVPLSSAPLSGPAGDQTFPTTGNLSLGLTSADLDYNMTGSASLGVQYPSFLGSGSIGSTTLSPANDVAAHLTSVPLGAGQTLLRLSIPFQTTITETLTGFSPSATGTISFTFSGSIAAFAVVPEPTSMALIGIGLACLAPVGVRRLRRKRIG